MSSTEVDNTKGVETETPSLLPYREFVISTLATKPSEDALQSLLSPSMDIFEFTKKTRGLGETKVWLNGLRFDIPSEALTSLAQNLIEANKTVLDRIAAIPEGKHTFENTLQALIIDEVLSSPLQSSLDFVSDVSPSKEVRDAANDAKNLLEAYSVDASARVDVYNSINAFSATQEARTLTGEKHRYLQRLIRDFRRDGLHLPKEELDQIITIRKEMVTLSIQFHANLGEEDTKFTFTRDQLKGLSEDQLKALTKAEGVEDSFVVTLKTPDYVPIMQYCSIPETRRILEAAYNSRCIDQNTKIMERLIELRAKQAVLLGFPTHAAYVLDTRMAKTPETVRNFLETLNKQIEPLYQRDQEALLATKKKEREAAGEAFDNILHPYDRSFYSRLYEAETFSIDHQALKEYFPLSHAFSGMFKLYEQLFSIKFEKIEGDGASGVWHQDVEMYNVLDRAPGYSEHDVLGQFYIDMHPRQGKYSHAAVFPLIQGCVDPENSDKRILPVSAIVCNFPKPTEEKPSLISHSDLTTLLHEFGHCLHAVLSKTELPRFAGTAVARDFVEAPSQMLENWCWYPESLAMLSKHFRDGSAIPEEMLKNLIATRSALQGAFNKRQLIFGLVDQRLHSCTPEQAGSVDTAKVYSDTMFEVMGYHATPGTNMISSFGHLAGGYDATYYGYLWSEVFAADMFVSRFGKEGIMNSHVGLEYRRKILQQGDSHDASDILIDFLGRQPNQDAFLKQKGL